MTAIKAFNILGQQVLSKNINATESEVDMSALHSGTYLVKAYAGEEVRTFKVIKQ
ncbi:T9SS type A sorting domain-containing protein [Flavobacterium lindanitolerans]|nr:T9SS type A sorting domain-containing protein [Flavobacterium lindanitolerans]